MNAGMMDWERVSSPATISDRTPMFIRATGLLLALKFIARNRTGSEHIENATSNINIQSGGSAASNKALQLTTR